MRRGLTLTCVALALTLVGTACSEKEKKTTSGPETKPVAAGRSETQLPVEQAVKTTHPAPASAKPAQTPVTPEEIAGLRKQIELATGDYEARIEARRVLMHRLRRDGQIEVAMEEFTALLEDVEEHQDIDMAQRVAASDAGALETQKDYATAIRTYDVLLERYGDGRFAAEAVYHQGLCHLELRDYATAAATWQRLIEEYDGSPIAPWGWRKLALVQTLEGQFDDALATLDMMATKYAGTEFEDYAAMRCGYVQMTAGRYTEARRTYDAFMQTRVDSKYRLLVQRQLKDLDRAQSVAQADGQVAGR